MSGRCPVPIPTYPRKYASAGCKVGNSRHEIKKKKKKTHVFSTNISWYLDRSWCRTCSTCMEKLLPGNRSVSSLNQPLFNLSISSALRGFSLPEQLVVAGRGARTSRHAGAGRLLGPLSGLKSEPRKRGERYFIPRPRRH